MTVDDFNKMLEQVRTTASTAQNDLQSIKKEKLQLSARIKIERADAKLSALRTFLNIRY